MRALFEQDEEKIVSSGFQQQAADENIEAAPVINNTKESAKSVKSRRGTLGSRKHSNVNEQAQDMEILGVKGVSNIH